MKLWVLPESIRTITFFILIYPSILRVWGVLIPANALQILWESTLQKKSCLHFHLEMVLVLVLVLLLLLHNLCRIISFHHIYDPYCTRWHNWNMVLLLFIHLLRCQSCRLSEVRIQNMVLFIVVSGRLSSSHIFVFQFPCHTERFL